MNFQPNGSLPSTDMSGDHFTGEVWADSIVEAPEPARIRGLVVHFQPGARTNWHTHPLGQTLYVLSGRGLVQCWNGPIRELRPGDVVWIEPGEKHWHGAAPENVMSHLALQEALDGSAIDWLEPVSDAQYQGKS